MPTTTHSTTVSNQFCCRHCGADVALDLSYGGELYYQCQNQKCQWAGSIHCLEALALKEVAGPLGSVAVGTLDGEPVIGTYDDESNFVFVSATWMEREVVTDGVESVGLPMSGEMTGDMSLAEYGWLKEAIASGMIDRLIRLAHAYVGRSLTHAA